MCMCRWGSRLRHAHDKAQLVAAAHLLNVLDASLSLPFLPNEFNLLVKHSNHLKCQAEQKLCGRIVFNVFYSLPNQFIYFLSLQKSATSHLDSHATGDRDLCVGQFGLLCCGVQTGDA